MNAPELSNKPNPVLGFQTIFRMLKIDNGETRPLQRSEIIVATNLGDLHWLDNRLSAFRTLSHIEHPQVVATAVAEAQTW